MSPATPTNPPAVQLLSFQIAAQAYALDLRSVREICRWSAPTPLPLAPDYLSGLINLRGTVLPVIDAAIRLGLRPTEGNAVRSSC